MILTKLKDKQVFKISKFAFVLSLLAVFIAIVSGVVDLQLFFNTDALYLPTIYKGLFQDGYAFESWQFPDAPFFFPDFLFYVVFHTLFQNYFIANLLTAYSIYVLIVLVLLKIFLDLIPKKAVARKSLLLLGLTSFNLLIAGGYLFIHTVLLISPVFHAGELLGALLLILLLLKVLQKERNWIYLAVFMLTAAVTFSDRSLIKDFTAPFFITYGVLFLVEQKLSDKLWKFGGALVAGTLIGNFFYRSLIPHTKSIPGIVSFAGKNLSSLLADFSSFFSFLALEINVASERIPFINLMSLFTILVVLAYIMLGKGLYEYIMQKRQKTSTTARDDLVFVLSLIILSQALMNATATIFFGYYRSLIHIRYFTPTFIVPIVGILFLLGIKVTKLKKPASLNRIYLGLIFLNLFLFASLGVSIVQKRDVDYFSYKPPNTQCIDSLAKERGLTHGLSDLWNSATNTLFSTEGVEVVQIDTLGPYIESNHWLNSTQRILQKSANNTEFPDYSFVLTSKIGEQNIINTLGEPLERIQCPQTDVLVYDPDEIKPVLEGNFSSKYFFEKLQAPGDKEEILGSDFNTDLFDFHGRMTLLPSTIETTTLIRDPNQEKGFFTQGPYITLKRGSYKFQMQYRTTADDPGYIELSFIPPKTIKPLPLENTNGELQTIEFTVDLGLNKPKIEENTYNVGVVKFAAFHTGNGKIVLEKLLIERVL